MSGQLDFEEEDRSALLRRAWDLSLHLLATKVSNVTLETWIRPTQPLSYVGNVATLGVASPFAREWLEKKAANAIRSALEFHLDTTGLQVVFVVMSKEQRSSGTRKGDVAARAAAVQTSLALDTEEESEGEPARDAEAQTADNFAGKPVEQTTLLPRSKSEETSPPSSPPTVGRPPAGRKSKGEARKPEPVTVPSLPLNDRYLFETFLVGRSNRLAHAGAMQVAARPGEVYNPLFLYGGPGLGKTHLMQGIAHSIRLLQPKLRIAYVSGEYFAQQYIAALRDHATEDFRRQYREVDVWLVDDIQFIAGKEHTKEEFFHTFNALYQSGKQIVIASDRSPRELNTMDERLKSRFQSGLIADIGAPELETRIAILQQCRQRENAQVADDVLEYIASAIQSNMRALEGALTRLIAYSSIMSQPATAELAQSVLSEYFIEKPIRQRKIAIEEIVQAVAEEFGLTPAAILGPNRNKDVSFARHVAMYLSRELLPEMNTTLTGAAFGGRDHATIVYACQRVRPMMDLDPELKALVSRLTRRLSV